MFNDTYFDNLYNQGNQQYSSTLRQNFGPAFNSNKIYVKSAEEALYRTTQRNSHMVYFDESETVLYEVRCDMEGKKQFRTRYLNDSQIVNTSNDLEQRVQRIEQALFKANEVPNAE